MRRECLTTAELAAFNLGDLPDVALDEITEHLECCPHCERAARSLDRLTDPMIDALRDTAATAPDADPLPARVGSYEILGELGRGGMGVVYRARHLQLGRIAALKMLLGGEFSDPEERARFQTEAEAAARLQHPNIVQVYEVGEYVSGADGLGVGARPYFTLEYVEGGNLSQRLAGRPQPPRHAAAWLEPLACAVHYAHQRGVVHRDVKPSNVLLTPDNQPKLCDFGVAKVLSGSDLKTRSGALIGTVEYMAPEQAAARTDIGPAADVYSLGALLYTMLTGRPPFQEANPLDTLAQLRSQEPVSPRRLNPQVPRDLETICLKCLQKEPHKRYPSAEALAEDLRRFLGGVPITARPVGRVERLVKWSRRNPTVAGMLTTVLLVTAVAFVLIAWKWREAVEQRGWADDRAAAEAQARADEAQARGVAQQAAVTARDAQREAERSQADELLSQATTLCERGEVAAGLLTFARGLDVAVRANDADLERVARQNLALWSRMLVRHRGTFPHGDWVTAVALSADGRTLATASLDATARLWDAATGRPIGDPLVHCYPVWSLAFSRDGKLLLTGSGENDAGGEVRLWEAGSGEPVGAPMDHHAQVTAVAFSPDGKKFLTVSTREAQLWDTGTRARIGPTLRHGAPASQDPNAPPALLTGALSPDGRIVLTGGGDGTARLWDAATGKPLAVLRHEGPVAAVAFSPDSATALTGSLDATAHLWQTATGQPVGAVLRHRGPVRAVAFAPDGGTVATGSTVAEPGEETEQRLSGRGEARVWSAATGQPLAEPLAHPRPVRTVALNADGLLLTGAADRCARVYDVASGQLVSQPLLHEGTVMSCALSADGRTVVTGAAGYGPFQAARLWNLPRGLRTGVTLLPSTTETWRMQFNKGGQLVTGGRDGAVRRWDTQRGTPIGAAPQRNRWVLAVALSHDDRTMAVAWSDRTVCLFDRDGKQLLHTWHFNQSVNAVSYSADDRTILTACGDGTARRWDVTDGQALGTPLVHGTSLWTAALAPDEKTVVTLGDDGVARRWDRESGRLVGETRQPGAPPGLQGQVVVAALAPDARYALTARRGPHAQLWSIADGAPLGPPLSHRTLVVTALCFADDGRTVLTGSDDGAARLWDAATGRPLGPPLAHATAVTGLTFAPGGRVLATAEGSGFVHLWNNPAALAGRPESVQLWVELLTATAFDAHGAARELDPTALTVRRQQLERYGDLPPPE